METTLLVIDWFTCAESRLLSIHKPFLKFVKVAQNVRRWKQNVKYVTSSTQISAPNFEWYDSPHKFAAIFDQKSEGNWSFSIFLLTPALLILIFFLRWCVSRWSGMHCHDADRMWSRNWALIRNKFKSEKAMSPDCILTLRFVNELKCVTSARGCHLKI